MELADAKRELDLRSTELLAAQTEIRTLSERLAATRDIQATITEIFSVPLVCT